MTGLSTTSREFGPTNRRGRLVRAMDLLRQLSQSGGRSWLLFRFRYLIGFVLAGFLAILFELLVLQLFFPGSQQLGVRLFGFAVSMLVSFVLNVLFNFRVPAYRMAKAFVSFTAISSLSFALNLGVIHAFRSVYEGDYAAMRLITAGSLFGVAYFLHRRFTFCTFRKNALIELHKKRLFHHAAFANNNA